MATVVYEPRDKRYGELGEGLGRGLQTFAKERTITRRNVAQREHEKTQQERQYGFEKDLRTEIEELRAELQETAAKKGREFDREQFDKTVTKEVEQIFLQAELKGDAREITAKQKIREIKERIRVQAVEDRKAAGQRQEFDQAEGALNRQSRKEIAGLQTASREEIQRLKAAKTTARENEAKAKLSANIMKQYVNVADRLNAGFISVEDAQVFADSWNNMNLEHSLNLPTISVNEVSKKLMGFDVPFTKQAQFSSGGVPQPQTGVGQTQIGPNLPPNSGLGASGIEWD